MKKWSEVFNISLPECGQCGICCKAASPSSSYKTLLEKAAQGEDFARDFFSIFVPYDIKYAEKNYPEIVERSLKAFFAKKICSEDLVFYRCIYYSEKNQCEIYEDRPELCRDFPGTPFVILDERCSFYYWAKECKEKYKNLQKELKIIKKYKKEISHIKYQQNAVHLNSMLKNTPENYKFAVLCPSLGAVSPAYSWIKRV